MLQNALELSEKAIALGEDLMGAEDPKLGDFYNTHATNLRRIARFEEALVYSDKCTFILEKAYEPTHYELGIVYYNRAIILYELADLSGAKSFISRALEILKTAFKEQDNHTYLKEVDYAYRKIFEIN